jgi:hypothetical protein
MIGRVKNSFLRKRPVSHEFLAFIHCEDLDQFLRERFKGHGGRLGQRHPCLSGMTFAARYFVVLSTKYLYAVLFSQSSDLIFKFQIGIMYILFTIS